VPARVHMAAPAGRAGGPDALRGDAPRPRPAGRPISGFPKPACRALPCAERGFTALARADRAGRLGRVVCRQELA
jgi:hypothetical protein